MWRKVLCANLSEPIAAALMALTVQEAQQLTEIRVRMGEKTSWVFADGNKKTSKIAAKKDVEELVGALCGYSRYAHEAQLAQGFIALHGGHRAGVCGRVVYEKDRIVRMSAVRSVCIRIARRIEGASAPFREHLVRGGLPASVLILGPPGTGKTTALRDAARYLAEECGFQVAVADEREELFAQEGGAAIDVICGAKKADALRMMVRSMAPQVVVTDEIGDVEDAHALLDASACGVGVLASAHAGSFEEAMRRPALRMLCEQGAFEKYVLLKGRGCCAEIVDQRGRTCTEGLDGERRGGDAGADCHQHDGIFSGGWGKASAQMGLGDATVFASSGRCDPL